MLKLMLSLVLAVSAVQAADPDFLTRSKPSTEPSAATFRSQRNLWRYSLGALALANALDMKSSWGRRELNPLTSSQQGTFGVQGALIKLGIQGGVIGLEYLALHRHPSKSLYKRLAIINFVDAGTVGGIVAHNYTTRVR
jgi:hypothetical protein